MQECSQNTNCSILNHNKHYYTTPVPLWIQKRIDQQNCQNCLWITSPNFPEQLFENPVIICIWAVLPGPIYDLGSTKRIKSIRKQVMWPNTQVIIIQVPSRWRSETFCVKRTHIKREQFGCDLPSLTYIIDSRSNTISPPFLKWTSLIRLKHRNTDTYRVSRVNQNNRLKYSKKFHLMFIK